MHKLDSQARVRLILIFLAAGLYVSLGFVDMQPRIPVPWDKLAHVAFAGGLVALMVWSVRIPLGIAVFCTVALGAVDEISQMFMSGRSPDIRDLFADSAGAFLCMAAIALFRRWRREVGSR